MPLIRIVPIPPPPPPPPAVTDPSPRPAGAATDAPSPPRDCPDVATGSPVARGRDHAVHDDLVQGRDLDAAAAATTAERDGRPTSAAIAPHQQRDGGRGGERHARDAWRFDLRPAPVLARPPSAEAAASASGPRTLLSAQRRAASAISQANDRGILRGIAHAIGARIAARRIEPEDRVASAETAERATGLNFFLAREIRDERAELGAGPQPRA